MDTSCLQGLVGIRDLCQNQAVKPIYYLDNQGFDVGTLSKLATFDGSGKAYGQRIISDSIQFLLADIESAIPPKFQIKNELSSICANSTFTSFYAPNTSMGSGIMIKNTTFSPYSKMVLENLKIRINNTGTFTIIITDGKTPKSISYAFTAGNEVLITGINYETTEPFIKAYFQDIGLSLAQLTLPTNAGCGCRGNASSTVTKEIAITGLANGMETSQQSAFIPCVKVNCSYDKIICSLVSTVPRLVGMALLYQATAKILADNAQSLRTNRVASENQEEKDIKSSYFYGLYRERIYGNTNKNIQGLTSIISTNLSRVKDSCVSCNSNLVTAWATG